MDKGPQYFWSGRVLQNLILSQILPNKNHILVIFGGAMEQ